MDWVEGELLGFDLETTGPDPFDAVPVSYALATFVGGEVVARDGALVDPDVPIPPGATAIHGVTDAQARAEGRPLRDALAHVRDTLLDAAARGVPVVGMNLSYDLTIVERLGDTVLGAGLRARGWDGPALDVLVIDRHLDPYRKGRRKLADLCAHYGVLLEGAHEAGADAEAAVAVLLRICQQAPALVAEELGALHRLEARWQREWAAGYDDWRASRSMTRLEPGAYRWPISC